MEEVLAKVKNVEDGLRREVQHAVVATEELAKDLEGLRDTVESAESTTRSMMDRTVSHGDTQRQVQPVPSITFHFLALTCLSSLYSICVSLPVSSVLDPLLP